MITTMGAWALVLLGGCQDQGFAEVRLDAIATVMGDFDDVSQLLYAQDIGSAEYNGYIVQATWDTTDDPPRRDDPGLSVEELFSAADEKGDLEIRKYNAVFVNSGTRGLNAWVYNDALTADDALLIDDYAIGNVCDFVSGGGTLVASDWSYDLVEACWPEVLEMSGEDTVVDAAQLGVAGTVLADVVDADLAEALGTAVLSLNYNFSAWSVVESVGGAATVLLSGDVTYQPDEKTGYAELDDVPLLVRFSAGNGQVVFSTFHWLPQNGPVAQGLLLNVVEGLDPGAGSESAEAAGG